METVYFVEDDNNIRKLVCYALDHEGYDVKGFAAPSDFYSAYRADKPDLVLLDIMLPEEDGLSVLKKIRNTDPDMSVIMLTAKGSEYDKVMGLDMGADDYIAKPFGMTELVSRIRAVLRRSRRGKTDSSVYKMGILLMDTEKHTVTVSGRQVTLSFKEFALLKALLEAEGRVLSRDELFSRIWGEYYGESRTLDVHIRNLRIKLGKAGSYIKTVKNVGYKMGGADE